MLVNICGIKYEVAECEDNFDVDLHFGMIDHKECKIKINKSLPEDAKRETICHEMVHGMLIHLGFSEESNNEQFVQALGNAIYQGFSIKEG